NLGVTHTAESKLKQLNNEALDAAYKNFPLTKDEADGRMFINGEIPTPSQRCLGKTKQGDQCRGRTKDAHLCHHHRRIMLGLQIRKSLLKSAGRGLFATREFKPGEEIAKYTGDLLLSEDSFGDGSDYILALSKDHAIDAARK